MAYTDSPDGLVSDNDVLPVVLLDDLGKSLDLAADDLVRLVALALLESLTDAEDDLDVLLQGSLGLLGDELVGFVEESSALRVTEDDPFESDVLELVEAGTESGGVRQTIRNESQRQETHEISPV